MIFSNFEYDLRGGQKHKNWTEMSPLDPPKASKTLYWPLGTLGWHLEKIEKNRIFGPQNHQKLFFGSRSPANVVRPPNQYGRSITWVGAPKSPQYYCLPPTPSCLYPNPMHLRKFWKPTFLLFLLFLLLLLRFWVPRYPEMDSPESGLSEKYMVFGVISYRSKVIPLWSHVPKGATTSLFYINMKFLHTKIFPCPDGPKESFDTIFDMAYWPLEYFWPIYMSDAQSKRDPRARRSHFQPTAAKRWEFFLPPPQNVAFAHLGGCLLQNVSNRPDIVSYSQSKYSESIADVFTT